MKIYILSFLIVISSLSFAMENTFSIPSSEVLVERIRNIGLQDFIEKTQIIQEIAGKKLSPMNLYMSVDEAIVAYQRYALQHPKEAADEVFGNTDSKLLAAIWQDCPRALGALEAEGLYKPMQ